MTPEPEAIAQDGPSREAARSLNDLLAEIRSVAWAIRIVIEDAAEQFSPDGQRWAPPEDHWEAIMGMSGALARDTKRAGILADDALMRASTEPPGMTPIARLWQKHRALEAATVTSDAESDARLDALNDLEMQIAEAPARTPRDMAMKVWLARECLQHNGVMFDVILDDIARSIGPEAVADISEERKRNAEFWATADFRKHENPDAEIFNLIEQHRELIGKAETAPTEDECARLLKRASEISMEIARAEPGTIKGYAAKIALIHDYDGLKVDGEDAKELIRQARALSGLDWQGEVRHPGI